MSSQAKILEVDATPVCPDDFVLPPHYAINKALAAIYNSQKIRGSEEHWLWGFAPAVAAGRCDLEALSRDIESGPTSCATMTSCGRVCSK